MFIGVIIFNQDLLVFKDFYCLKQVSSRNHISSGQILLFQTDTYVSSTKFLRYKQGFNFRLDNPFFTFRNPMIIAVCKESCVMIPYRFDWVGIWSRFIESLANPIMNNFSVRYKASLLDSDWLK